MTVRAPIVRLAPGVRTLSEETSRHLCRVLRLREGSTFRAFDPESRVEADAVLEKADPEAAVARIGELQAARVVAERNLVLVYALAKGEKVDAVVRDATELGATHVFLARTARSVVKADADRARTKLDRFRRVAEQAARQCGRADPPVVEGVLAWAEALDAAAAASSARYCLDVRATSPLGATLPAAVAASEGLAFAIGPEGGFTDDEVEEAKARGFAIASLGRFVLRTETVAAAVLGAVRVLDVAEV